MNNTFQDKNKPNDEYATCEWSGCRKRDLKSEFYGSKRFCSRSCSGSFNASQKSLKNAKKDANAQPNNNHVEQ